CRRLDAGLGSYCCDVGPLPPQNAFDGHSLLPSCGLTASRGATSLVYSRKLYRFSRWTEGVKALSASQLCVTGGQFLTYLRHPASAAPLSQRPPVPRLSTGSPLRDSFTGVEFAIFTPALAPVAMTISRAGNAAK